MFYSVLPQRNNDLSEEKMDLIRKRTNTERKMIIDKSKGSKVGLEPGMFRTTQAQCLCFTGMLYAKSSPVIRDEVLRNVPFTTF